MFGPWFGRQVSLSGLEYCRNLVGNKFCPFLDFVSILSFGKSPDGFFFFFVLFFVSVRFHSA